MKVLSSVFVKQWVRGPKVRRPEGKEAVSSDPGVWVPRTEGCARRECESLGPRAGGGGGLGSQVPGSEEKRVLDFMTVGHVGGGPGSKGRETGGRRDPGFSYPWDRRVERKWRLPQKVPPVPGGHARTTEGGIWCG